MIGDFMLKMVVEGMTLSGAVILFGYGIGKAIDLLFEFGGMRR